MCTVIIRTPSLSSSRIGASDRLRGVRGNAQFLDEAAKRNPTAHFVLSRELGDVQDVRERLLAAGAQREPYVRARRGQ